MAMNPERVKEAIAALGGWTIVGDGEAIKKSYTFPSYRGGVAFASYVAELAEAADHHPDLLIGYCRVEVALSSHDAGGVTGRDLRLAAQIDGVELPPGATS